VIRAPAAPAAGLQRELSFKLQCATTRRRASQRLARARATASRLLPSCFCNEFASRAAASAKARGKARWYIDALLKVPWWRFREQNAEGQYHNFVKKAIINAKIIPTGSQRGIAETAWWMRSRSRPRGVRSARLRELHGGGGSVSGVQVRQIKTLALTGPDEATFITYQISTNSGRAGSGQLD